MNICDNSLLRAEAFLNSADKAATRFHDSHISAQAEFTVAKLEWAKEPVGETWANRCARVIPSVKQGKIDDTVAGRFPKIVQEFAATLSPAEYEDRLKALAEENGMTYRTPEEREAYVKELGEVMAAKRAALTAATNAARDHGGRDQEKIQSNAERFQSSRKEAETIRVANGGAPTLVRPTPVVPTFDKERDAVMIRVLSKLPLVLTAADLTEVEELIDALTWASGPAIH